VDAQSNNLQNLPNTRTSTVFLNGILMTVIHSMAIQCITFISNITVVLDSQSAGRSLPMPIFETSTFAGNCCLSLITIKITVIFDWQSPNHFLCILESS